MKFVRITHKASGLKLAEGPIGWGITPFEGNYYVRGKYLATDRLKPNFIPGLCPYKFLYVWLDLKLGDGRGGFQIWVGFTGFPTHYFLSFGLEWACRVPIRNC